MEILGKIVRVPIVGARKRDGSLGSLRNLTIFNPAIYSRCKKIPVLIVSDDAYDDGNRVASNFRRARACVRAFHFAVTCAKLYTRPPRNKVTRISQSCANRGGEFPKCLPDSRAIKRDEARYALRAYPFSFGIAKRDTEGHFA